MDGNLALVDALMGESVAADIHWLCVAEFYEIFASADEVSFLKPRRVV